MLDSILEKSNDKEKRAQLLEDAKKRKLKVSQIKEELKRRAKQELKSEELERRRGIAKKINSSPNRKMMLLGRPPVIPKS